MLSLLLGVVALTPTMLSAFLFNLYGKTKFTMSFFVSMLCMTLWQIDDSLLYLNGVPSHILLIMVKLFRIGQIMFIPSLVLCLYIFFDQNHHAKGTLSKLHAAIFNMDFVKIAYFAASILYIINWTPYDIQRLVEVHSPETIYFKPVYGSLSYLFKSFCFLYLPISVVTFWSAFRVSEQMKNFILTFTTNTTIIFVVAMINFLPGAHYVVSGLVVLMTSIIMVFAFMKMYNNVMKDYHTELERQRKLNTVGNMVSSLMHEVKNSLTIIKGSADLMNMGATNPELVKAIIIGSSQLNDLVQSFHQFIKSDLNLDFAYDRVNDTIMKAIVLSKNVVNDAGATVRFESNTKFVKAHINSTHLAQVLLNLIKNSVEAMPAESEDKRVTIRLASNADDIIIDVKDNGTGIPRHMWDKVFTGFHSSKSNGMGLGLAYCQKIITAHHGTIRIVDSDSTGTHIQILLPQHKFHHLIAG